MDATDIFFRLAGGFYLVAGWFGVRTVLMDSLLDKALAALSAGKEDPAERGRRWIVGTSTVGIGASGAALLAMSSWALPLFLASTAAQAAWIAGGRRFFIPEEEDDEAARRQVVNAPILYGAVTAGVVWLWSAGRLAPWGDPLGIAAPALAAAGLGAWFVHHMAWKAPSPGGFGDDDPAPAFDEDEEAPSSVTIDPAFGSYPLVDAATGRRFNHFRWLDEELAGRIEDWDDGFQLAFGEDSEWQEMRFPSTKEEAAWRADGLAIAGALEAVYGSANVSIGEGWLRPPARNA